MSVKNASFILIAILFLGISTPDISTAVTRFVVSDGALCSSLIPNPNTNNDECYTSLQTAITDAQAATTSDVIEIRPGIHTAVNVTVTKNIPIRGVETARTFLTGNGSGTILIVNGVNNPTTIKNLTFINASVGIQVDGASSLNIKNNVFEVGNASVGILLASTASPVIMNNVFYLNGTAISSSQTTLSIVNNIFSNNALVITNTVGLTEIKYNLFWQNTTIGPIIEFAPGDPEYLGNIQLSDPLFVNKDDTDITKRDFHLKFDALNNNPCRNTGHPDAAGNDSVDNTRADIGAYGGSASDTIPYPVAFDAPAPINIAPGSVTLSWSPNISYIVSNPAAPGAYKVYYDLNKAGAPYAGIGLTEGPSPINSPATNITLNNLLEASAPAAPVQNNPQFSNNTLKLSWGAVSGATGYIVYILDTVTAVEEPHDVGPVLSFDIGGLINGREYTTAITAYAQNTYHFAVTVYDGSGITTRTPGVEHESAYSEEKLVTVGNRIEGPRSNAITEYPDAIEPTPNLPNTGCFIATAAYGYYSAPQVQALRDFRDQYLLKNAPGRAFVQWYYQYGPRGAQYINQHPWLKPVVRTALMPAVGGAMFMTRTSVLIKMFVSIGMIAVCSVGIYSRRNINRPR